MGRAFVFGYLHSLDQAHAVSTARCLGPAMVLAESVRLQDKDVVAEVPVAAWRCCAPTRTTASSATGIADAGSGAPITGYADLPAPPPGLAALPASSTPTTRGSGCAWRACSMVLAGAERRAAGAGGRDAGRQAPADELAGALRLTAVQLSLIALSAGLITFGVRRGLSPLKRLHDEVKSRDPADSSRWRTRTVPREVVPLIDAIN
ncbi:MAG: sensor histidine kinase N-terminal domain-containing protein, partial [Betaproteobacteria bacterium]|nr:sensor histidine kinase N-terminal domain-containing protein [Betaproteobacteria bacterium]